ncbi:hypothetical protein ACFVRD_48500 [Streptomyces sp. NPDC057908]|uniref:hypothetical protein n=1 Tax=Streptomyces sp. NPDC057908 TaxID=3346276 RepID=UPI0036E544E1
MTDATASPDPARPQPRRLGGRMKAGIAVGAVLCLAAGVGGGFFVGRSAAEKDFDRASCAETRKTVLDMGQEAGAAQAGSVQAANIIRTQLHMMLQNPDCFPARVRGEAQTALDQGVPQGTDQAGCGRWWKCNMATASP